MTELPVGKHIVGIDKDILFLRMNGDLLEADLDSYFTLADQIIAKHGGFFVLDDMTRFGTISPAGRKRLVHWILRVNCRGAAIYGASPTSRAVASLILGATKLLGSKVFPIAFTKTEYEARQWIAAQRK